MACLRQDMKNYPSGFEEGHPRDSIAHVGQVSTLCLCSAFHADLIPAHIAVFATAALDLWAVRFADDVMSFEHTAKRNHCSY